MVVLEFNFIILMCHNKKLENSLNINTDYDDDDYCYYY